MRGHQPFVHFKRVRDSLRKGEPYNSPSLINKFSTYIYMYIYMFVCVCIQSVPGGMCQTSGECFLC